MSIRTAPAHDPLARAPVVLGLAAAATATGAIAVVLLATSSILEAPGQAALRTGGLIVAHIAPALYLWWRRPTSRFPALLLIVALGFCGWGLVGLGGEWAHYLGRLFTFIALPLALYPFLAFPGGRLADRASRAVVASLTLVATGGWLALGLIGPVVPTTIPTFACGDACPQSPVAIGDDQGLADEVTRVVFVVGAALTLWGVMLLAGRLRRAPGGGRLAMALVVVAASINVVIAVAWLLNGAANGTEDAPAALLVAFAFSRFALPIALTVAVLLDQGRSSRALRSLLESMAPGHDDGDLRLALAGVLRDPDLVIARRSGDGWVDLEGCAVPPPQAGDRRSWTEVAGADGRPTVALLHDPSLGETPDMVNAAAAAAAIAVHQQELTAGLRTAVDDLRASRSRLATAADEERRRLERDLHDSAQQGLVALRVRVAVARETLDGDVGAAARALDDIDTELGAVLDDLRRLSRGLYPPLLEARGLVEALRSAASRSPMAVSVEGDVGRLPRQIEVAAYFCCREALQNAAKHAGRDAHVTVSLSEADGSLHFAVTDDGPGFDAAADSGGIGLTGMRDRAGAVGGRLDVRASPAGTTVAGVLPLDQD